MCGASTSPTMPTCCRPICASCAASSTARTCRSTSRARCCRTIRRSAQIRKASPAASSASSKASPTRSRRLSRRSGTPSARSSRKASTRITSGASQLLTLARFDTTAGDSPRSLKQYVADLKPNQTEIYYLVGESAERLKSNPKLEAARARGIEVLLLTDPVDAFWTVMPQDFEGKPLRSLSQGDVDFGLVPLLEQAKTSRRDEAPMTRTSGPRGGEGGARRAGLRRARLAAPDRQPACLVASAQGRDRELERLLARQNRGVGAKPILELNMRHALVKALGARAEEGRGRRMPISRRCCSTRRTSSTARCRPIRPPSPAAQRLVVRGLGRAARTTQVAEVPYRRFQRFDSSAEGPLGVRKGPSLRSG